MTSFYVFKDKVFKNLEDAESYIAENERYLTEEGLMFLCENEIFFIDDEKDLEEYALSLGYLPDDFKKEYGLEIVEEKSNFDGPEVFYFGFYEEKE